MKVVDSTSLPPTPGLPAVVDLPLPARVLYGFGAILEEAKRLGIAFAPDEDMLDLKGQAMSRTLAGLAQRLGGR